MAGHSKWSNIKRKKGAADAKRGKLFTKLIREIQVAARLGGGDLEGNPRLRDAVIEAKSNNMPKETYERAIKRGTGDLEGVSYESITYEGYGPSGVAMLIESLTDNRNRTVAELRALMTRNGGSLGEAGSVAWIFDRKGLIAVKKEGVPEERIMELSLNAGAEDLKDEGGVWEVVTPPSEFNQVNEAIQASGAKVEFATVSTIPKNTVRLEGEDAEKMLKLMELIEDLDDIQKVHANFDIDEQQLEHFGS